MTKELEESRTEIERRKEATEQAAAFIKPDMKKPQPVFPSTVGCISCDLTRIFWQMIELSSLFEIQCQWIYV